MINENILGKCFRISSSLINHRISPLTIKYECPQLSLLIITKCHNTNDTQSSCIIPCWTIQAKACLEHSNLLKVKYLIPTATSQCQGRCSDGCYRLSQALRLSQSDSRASTTSFLTATTLIYATGAGITAAAGTRLALQWILVKGFKLYSFQLPDLKRPGIVISCHYLPVSGLGNLRACCLPWMW